MPLKTKSAPKEHLGLTTRQKNEKYRAFYIMFIPLFLCLILFSHLPMFGILYAFTDYTPSNRPSSLDCRTSKSCSPRPAFGKRSSTPCRSALPSW